MLFKHRALLLSVIIGFLIILLVNKTEKVKQPKMVKSTSSSKSPIESKKGRMEYFFKMLRDPATNRIPQDIRRKELAFAKTLPSVGLRLNKVGASMILDWNEVGPNDVGGRTRAA